jgi:hypothetical protein
MEILKVKLTLRDSHETSHAVLHILVVVGLEVRHLIHHNSLIEST